MIRASHSEIATYNDCRRAHYFKHRLHLPVVGENERLIQGTAVHAGLASCAQDRVTPERAQEIAVESYRSSLAFHDDRCIAAIGSAVRAGCDFLASADIAKIMAVEERFLIDLDGWLVPGAIDLAYEDSHGGAHITDWKTCTKLPTDTTGVIDPQTALYAFVWMTRHGLEWMHAGRTYLLMRPTEIEITKKEGKVSLTSSVSGPDYRAYIAAHPEHAVAEDKAVKFGPWWRFHEDLVTLDYCRAILADWRRIAVEIDQNLHPHPNHRPKYCHVHCAYFGRCMDMTLNGPNNG